MLGPLAWWEDPDRPWLLRLDTATSWSLRPQIGEGGGIFGVAPDGAYVLVRGERDHVVSTLDGSVRTLPAQTTVALSPDGTQIASTAPGGDGTDVYVERIDGSERRLVATVPSPGLAILLTDGRTAVLGTGSELVQPDGTRTPLPPVPGARAPLYGPDGARILVTTDAGLALVDPAAGSVLQVADSPDPTPFDDGVRDLVWAAPASGDETGAVVVDPVAGTATTLLADLPTSAITSVGDDGRVATVQVGAGGTGTVLASADGTVILLAEDALAAEAVVHPDGEVVAVAAIEGATRSLRVGEAGQPGVEIPTGRNPVWLLTD